MCEITFTDAERDFVQRHIRVLGTVMAFLYANTHFGDKAIIKMILKNWMKTA